MSVRSALAGAATTVVVAAGLGNPAMVDATRDSDHQALVATIVGFVDWDVAGSSGEVVGLVAIRIGVLVVAAGLLCGLVGRSRSRAAAWLGAWGAVGVAAALAGAAAYAYEVPVVLDGAAPADTYVDGMVAAVNAGAAFGLWTGWLIGAVVALATRRAPVVAAEPHAPASAVPAAGSAAASEPPPPWWAPTYAADAGLRPGPTAFPPSGLGRPVVAGAGEPGATHHLSTASGDPHPSDPDATRPVGLPPHLAGGGDGADEPTVAPDPDATTAMPTESSAPDPTAELPHPPDR